MVRPDGPCKNCSDRHAACWDSCDKYKAYKAEVERINTARQRYQQKKRDLLIDIGKAISRSGKRR